MNTTWLDALPSNGIVFQTVRGKSGARKVEVIFSALAADGFYVVPIEPTTQQMESAGNAVIKYVDNMKQVGGVIETTDYALRTIIYHSMIKGAQGNDDADQ